MFLGNGHYVHAAGKRRPVEAEELPQKPLHPVTMRGMTDFPADGQPHPPVVGRDWPLKHEKDESLGMVASALLVTVKELLALDQAKGSRKP